MRITIDTENKTISLDDDIVLHDLLEEINSLLPNGNWREYKLKTTKIFPIREPLISPQNPTINRPWIGDDNNTILPYNNDNNFYYTKTTIS